MLGFLIFAPEKGAVFSVPAPYVVEKGLGSRFSIGAV